MKTFLYIILIFSSYQLIFSESNESFLSINSLTRSNNEIYTNYLALQSRRNCESISQTENIEQNNINNDDNTAKNLEALFMYLDKPIFLTKELRNLQANQRSAIFKLTVPDNSKLFNTTKSVKLETINNVILKSIKEKSLEYDWEKNSLDSVLLLNSFMLSDTIIELYIPKDENSFKYNVFDSVLHKHGIRINDLPSNKVILKKNYSILLYSHLNLMPPKLLIINTNSLFDTRKKIIHKVKYSSKDSHEEINLNKGKSTERESSNLYCYFLTGGFGVDVLNSLPAILGTNRILSGFYDGIDGFATGNIRYERILGDPQNKENLQLNSRINLVKGRFQGMSNIVTSINYRNDRYGLGPIIYIDNSKQSNIVPGINFCLHTPLNYTYKFNENNDQIMEPDFETDDITFQIIYFPNFNSISPLFFESNFSLIKNIDNRSSKLDFVYSIGASYYVISGYMFEKSNNNFYGGFKINFQIGFYKKGQGILI